MILSTELEILIASSKIILTFCMQYNDETHSSCVVATGGAQTLCVQEPNQESN